MQIRNTKELVNADNLKIKVLVYGLPGTGKTLWAGGAPNPGCCACETGQGNGLLTIADRAVDFVIPQSFKEVEEFCSGEIFKDKDSLIVDSWTEVVRKHIKAAALQIPRARGESDKRKQGIPELDDYQVMGELSRRLLVRLFDSAPDKHIIVTALEKYDKAGPDDPPGTESLIGPDLPGQMFLGAPAMFDFVLRMRTRTALRNPADAKSKYSQRFLVTQPEGGVVAKCRANSSSKALLDREEIFEPVEGKPTEGRGTFNMLLEKIKAGYTSAVVA